MKGRIKSCGLFSNEIKNDDAWRIYFVNSNIAVVNDWLGDNNVKELIVYLDKWQWRSTATFYCIPCPTILSQGFWVSPLLFFPLVLRLLHIHLSYFSLNDVTLMIFLFAGTWPLPKVTIPTVANHTLILHLEMALRDLVEYRTIVDNLWHLLLTWLDIAFIVNKLSWFLYRPTTNHWNTVKWLLC